MNAKQLIQKLQKLPEDVEVYVTVDGVSIPLSGVGYR